jgi:hypothetical protein
MQQPARHDDEAQVCNQSLVDCVCWQVLLVSGCVLEGLRWYTCVPTVQLARCYSVGCYIVGTMINWHTLPG